MVSHLLRGPGAANKKSLDGGEEDMDVPVGGESTREDGAS